MNSRKFKVLDSSGLGWGVNFDSQVLEYVGDSMIPGCVVLKQPEFDANGKPRTGLVTFDLSNVQEVEVPDELA